MPLGALIIMIISFGGFITLGIFVNIHLKKHPEDNIGYSNRNCNDDDELTNPAYDMIPGNIYNDD